MKEYEDFCKFMILVMCVDDILLDSNDLCMIRETKGYLENNFDMKDMGGATFVIGIEIFRDRLVSIVGTPTGLMIIDLLTKALPPKAYNEHVLNMGLYELPH